MILYPDGKVNILLIDFVFFENVISVTFHTLTALKMFVEVTLYLYVYTLKLASVTLYVMFVVKHIRIILIYGFVCSSETCLIKWSIIKPINKLHSSTVDGIPLRFRKIVSEPKFIL